MLRAGARIALQPFCQAFAWAGIASLPSAHYRGGLAIVSFEIGVEPFICPVAVVIDGQREIHGAGQRVWIAPRRASNFLDLVPLSTPLLGIRSNGKPAVEVAASALEACGQ